MSWSNTTAIQFNAVLLPVLINLQNVRRCDKIMWFEAFTAMEIYVVALWYMTH
jgi:hypothetical protein